MSALNETTRLIFDEKAFNILKVTSKHPKTTKEIANELKISTSNLYYSINKLLKIDALRITSQKQIGNITENSYSSEHLFNEEIFVNKEFLENNFDVFIRNYLLIQKNMLDLLEKDIKAPDCPQQDNVKIILSSIQLSQNDWNDLQDQILEFLDNINEPDSSNETVEITISAVKYK